MILDFNIFPIYIATDMLLTIQASLLLKDFLQKSMILGFYKYFDGIFCECWYIFYNKNLVESNLIKLYKYFQIIIYMKSLITGFSIVIVLIIPFIRYKTVGQSRYFKKLLK